jgi:hypothetical protein
MRERLIHDVEENFYAAIKAAKIAKLSNNELFEMLKLLMEAESNE